MSLVQRLALVLVFAALFAAPVLASAQTATLSELMTRVRELQARLAALQGTPTILPPPTTSCANLTTNMHVRATDAATGGEVTTLQNYLIANGYMTGPATGYFGPVTTNAVGKLQLSLGIATSLTDPNYGYVGPRTRGAIACTGRGSLSVIPSSGRAPLTVKFSGTVSAAGYTLDFGDDTPPVVTICSDCPTTTTNVSEIHVYDNPGSYTAILSANSQVVGRAIVVVTSASTTTPSATIDPRSLVSTSAHPLIYGTANNTDTVGLSIDKGGDKFDGTGTVSVVYWKLSFNPHQ